VHANIVQLQGCLFGLDVCKGCTSFFFLFVPFILHGIVHSNRTTPSIVSPPSINCDLIHSRIKASSFVNSSFLIKSSYPFLYFWLMTPSRIPNRYVYYWCDIWCHTKRCVQGIQ
jgi:hypothetical protein